MVVKLTQPKQVFSKFENGVFTLLMIKGFQSTLQ